MNSFCSSTIPVAVALFFSWSALAGVLAPQGSSSPACPGGEECPLTSEYLSIYGSDGSQCHHWTIKNIDSNSGSKQSVSVTWPDGTSITSEIAPGRTIIRDCFAKIIQAKELFTGTSTLCLTQT